MRVEDGFVCHNGDGTALAHALQAFDVPIGQRLFADFNFVFCQRSEDVDGSDFVPGLVGVQPQGNATADGFADGANAGDVFRFACANFNFDGFRAVLNMLFCRGCHFFRRVDADGAVGVNDFFLAAEQGI